MSSGSTSGAWRARPPTPEQWADFAPWRAVEDLQGALELVVGNQGGLGVANPRLALFGYRLRETVDDAESWCRAEPSRGGIPTWLDLLGAATAAARADLFLPHPAGLDHLDLARLRRAAWSLTDSRHGPLPEARARTVGGGGAPFWPEVRDRVVEALVGCARSCGRISTGDGLSAAVTDYAVTLARWTPPLASRYQSFPEWFPAA